MSDGGLMNTSNNILRDTIELRAPIPTDGDALHGLLAATSLLEGNTIQCSLLQCGHFAKTSVAACLHKELAGFVSAYCPPNEPDSLFVWQIVVAESVRGSGLAKKMLNWLIAQPSTESVVRLTTVVTLNHFASMALFESFARECGTLPAKNLLFKSTHNNIRQKSNTYLIRIEPLPNRPEKSIDYHLDDLRVNLRMLNKRR